MYKKIKSLIGVLLIGAVGSLLYDTLLKDFFFLMGSIFVNVATFIYSGYVDHLYSSVGKGDIFFQILPGVVIVVLILTSPYFIYKKMGRVFEKYEKPDEQVLNAVIEGDFISKMRKRANVFIFIITIPMLIIYTDMLIRQLSTIKACKKIERNLDIIRPYVSNQEYLILYSDYRKIDNKEKLIDLLDKIDFHAISKKIELPEIKLLGISTSANSRLAQ